MILRQENSHDIDCIYNFVKEAFSTAYVSDGKEQDFVNRIRNSQNYIPELAFVLETEDGEIVGHIMLTKLEIKDEQISHQALCLAPIAVKKEYRNQKAGSNLIINSLVKATELGYNSVFLVGDPKYYSRFGFEPTVKFGIKYVEDIPSQYVMCRELYPGALSGIKGTIEFPKS